MFGRLQLRNTGFNRPGALGENAAELRGLPLDLFIGQLGELCFELVDLSEDGLDALALTFMARSKHLSDQGLQHTDLYSWQGHRTDGARRAIQARSERSVSADPRGYSRYNPVDAM